jgi:hypothetical protein
LESSIEYKTFLITARALRIDEPGHPKDGKWDIRVSVLSQRRAPARLPPIDIGFPETDVDDPGAGMVHAQNYIKRLIDSENPMIPW